MLNWTDLIWSLCVLIKWNSLYFILITKIKVILEQYFHFIWQPNLLWQLFQLSRFLHIEIMSSTHTSLNNCSFTIFDKELWIQCTSHIKILNKKFNLSSPAEEQYIVTLLTSDKNLLAIHLIYRGKYVILL